MNTTAHMLYISHGTALHYWRTNPPWYVLEGSERNIRSLRSCPKTVEECMSFCLPEQEFGQAPYDVLVPIGVSRNCGLFHYHTVNAKLPPHSLYPVRDGIHVVSPELCFVQMCSRLDFIRSLCLGMELCGTYALRPDYPANKASRDYELIDVRALERHLESWKNLNGLKRARVAAQYLVNGSASPMETIVNLLLCLPQKYGGYNLPKPQLNLEIELAGQEVEILRANKVKPDMLWENARLIVEYDGEYHNEPMQRVRDEKRRAVLESKGYAVMLAKKQQVYDPLAFDSLANALARKLGKRVRDLTPKQSLARQMLREQLLGKGM